MSSENGVRLIAPPGYENFGIDRAGKSEGGGRIGGGTPGVGGAGETGFSQQLGQAIDSLDKLQTDADTQANAIANGGGNLHEVALAFEKADVAMRLATKVRNKLVETYTEIMRMSV
jgi:flagellar hook-basal body complex protein FliE